MMAAAAAAALPTPPSPPQLRKPRNRSAANAAAAFASSSLFTVSTYPFHRVKLLIQTQDANPAVISGASQRFTFFSAFGRLLREHGGRPAGLWHGATPYLCRHIPSVSISFAAKDAFRARLLPLVEGSSSSGGGGGGGSTRPLPLLAANAAAGGLAGALALAVVYPFELLTIRMAADVGGGTTRKTTAATTTTPHHQWQYGASPMEAARRAVARDGPRGLYRGFGVAVASAACYKALYFGLHDWAKVYLFEGRYDDDRGPSSSPPSSSPPPSPSSFIRTVLERLSIASGTTVLAATITHPLDVVRKRLVVDLKGELYGGTFAGCVRGIWRREGWRGFLRFLPQDALLRSGAGTILVTYDMLLSSTSSSAVVVAGHDRGGGGARGGGGRAAATETT